jgi:hypothetical protein
MVTRLCEQMCKNVALFNNPSTAQIIQQVDIHHEIKGRIQKVHAIINF